jgi:hypothetical protein
MTGWQDDDKVSGQGSFVDHAAYWKLVPYLIAIGATIYAFIFAPPEAAYVAWFFIVAIVMHFLIRMVLAGKAQDAAHAALHLNVTLPKRTQPAIPYAPDTVEVYMRDGRQYWVRHYQQENMADNIDFAEAHRRLHLRGLCDRNSCYFCHFHDMHAPYV